MTRRARMPTATTVRMPSWLYGIDPGLNGTGWAEFHDGALTAAGVLNVPHRLKTLPFELRGLELARQLQTVMCDAPFHTKVVCEMPHHFGNVGSDMGWKKGDLQKLTYLVGLFHGVLAPVDFQPVLVRDWKGQLPKAVVTERIKRILGDYACQQVGIVSHAWDAVGIGLWALGRF
jgi:hypothetical protein